LEPPGEPQEEPPWRSLRIDVVDALTGRELAATWNLGSGEVLAAPFGRDQVIDDAAIERQAKGVEASIAAWEGRFLPSGSVRADALWAGDYQVTRLLAVRPPPGFVLLTPPARVEAALAVGVDNLTAVVPVIREAVLDVPRRAGRPRRRGRAARALRSWRRGVAAHGRRHGAGHAAGAGHPAPRWRTDHGRRGVGPRGRAV
jgi:hypothetical protein